MGACGLVSGGTSQFLGASVDLRPVADAVPRIGNIDWSRTVKRDDKEQQFSIGDLCREFGVTPRAIRFYQTKGILHPTRRSGGLTRIFSRSDRARLKLTLRGKRAGFTLVEIKEILDLYDPKDGGELQRKVALEKGKEQIEFLRRQIAELTEALAELEKDVQCLEAGQGVDCSLAEAG